MLARMLPHPLVYRLPPSSFCLCWSLAERAIRQPVPWHSPPDQSEVQVVATPLTTQSVRGSAIEIKPTAPELYVVQKGDTLLDIAS